MHVLTYLLHQGKSKVLFFCLLVARHYLTLKKLCDMRNKQFYCKKNWYVFEMWIFTLSLPQRIFVEDIYRIFFHPMGVSWTVSFKTIHVRMLCYHADPFGVEHHQSFSTDPAWGQRSKGYQVHSQANTLHESVVRALVVPCQDLTGCAVHFEFVDN